MFGLVSILINHDTTELTVKTDFFTGVVCRLIACTPSRELLSINYAATHGKFKKVILGSEKQ